MEGEASVGVHGTALKPTDDAGTTVNILHEMAIHALHLNRTGSNGGRGRAAAWASC